MVLLSAAVALASIICVTIWFSCKNVKRLSNTMSLLMNYNKVLSNAISPAFLCLHEHQSPWTIPMVVAMIYRVVEGPFLMLS